MNSADPLSSAPPLEIATSVTEDELEELLDDEACVDAGGEIERTLAAAVVIDT